LIEGVGKTLFRLMSNEYAGDIHLVLALKRAKSEIWAAATPQSEAIQAVQERLGRGWKAVRIIETLLTPDRVASFKLRPNGVRKITESQ
jgi:hypothetical protein